MEMAFCDTEVLVSELAARKRDPLLSALNVASFLSLDRSLMQSSCFTPILNKIPKQPCQYLVLLAIGKEDLFGEANISTILRKYLASFSIPST